MISLLPSIRPAESCPSEKPRVSTWRLNLNASARCVRTGITGASYSPGSRASAVCTSAFDSLTDSVGST